MYEKEALELEAEEKAKKRTKGFACQENCEKSYVMGALDFAEPREKQIAELEERIRNQAESLGVTLLEEDKKAKRIKELEKANAELKSIADFQTSSNMDRYFQLKRSKEQLAKAKKVIEELYNIIPASMSDYAKEPMEHARKFMTEE